MAWRQAIIWTNDEPIHWRIYAALGGDKLTLVWLYHTSLQISWVVSNSIIEPPYRTNKTTYTVMVALAGIPNWWILIVYWLWRWSNHTTNTWQQGTHSVTGPCLTTATWRSRKNFNQWERNFLWKLRCHWVKGLRRRQIAVVRQGPGNLPASWVGTFRISGELGCLCRWSPRMTRIATNKLAGVGFTPRNSGHHMVVLMIL